MRSPFMSLFVKSPFENLKRHADKVSECARMFSQAVACHIDKKCEEFDDLTDQVAKLESEADAIKRNIRAHSLTLSACLLRFSKGDLTKRYINVLRIAPSPCLG